VIANEKEPLAEGGIPKQRLDRKLAVIVAFTILMDSDD
jgi:hypothetical protein